MTAQSESVWPPAAVSSDNGFNPTHMQTTSSSASGPTPPPASKGRLQACDRCRLRKRKCNGGQPYCNNCSLARSKGQQGIVCQYAEKKKRRKPRVRNELMARLEVLETLLLPLQGKDEHPLDDKSRAEARAEIAGLLKGLKKRNAREQIEAEQAEHDEAVDTDSEEDGDHESVGNGSIGNGSIVSGGTAASGTGPSSFPMVQSPSVMSSSGSVFSSSNLSLNGSMSALAPVTTPNLLSALPGHYDIEPFEPISWSGLISDDLMESIPDLSYSVAPNHFAQATNPRASISPSMAVTAAHIPADAPHLFTHLIALYFVSINTCMPIFDLAEFMTNLTPINRHHPAVLYAIYAYGALFSRHPALYQEPYKTPMNAVNMFIVEALNQVDDLTDICERCSVLVMLCKLCYGMGRPAQAYQFFGSAVQAAERAKLGFIQNSDENQAFTIWGSLPRADLQHHSPKTLIATWCLCFQADTLLTMGANANLLIDESQYSHILAMISDTEKQAPVNPPESSAEAAIKHWATFLESYCTYSIHDYRPAAWRPSWYLLESHCTKTKPWAMQMMYFSRRLYRFNRAMPFEVSPVVRTAADIVLKTIKQTNGNNMQEREEERANLHNALIEWWNALPATERAFDNLDVFMDGREMPRLPSVTQLASFQFSLLNLYFTGLFSWLHHREGIDLQHYDSTSEPLYPTGPHSNSPRVTSTHILLLTFRAHLFFIRAIYAMHGFASVSEVFLAPPGGALGAVPHTTIGPNSPPPPLVLMQNPLCVQSCFTVCLVHIRQISRLPPDNPQRNALREECVFALTNDMLPMFVNAGRVWPVLNVFVDRLRDAMRSLVLGEQIPTNIAMDSAAIDVTGITKEFRTSFSV
ncbi:uncharacterized protein EV422DRAFT_150448 [Fimicolochytrium jonesii]|uniref:uncharacterized protein n=1 Tax=Fimicolochytrium jonesii TaxID=1396493 RepID=UPI0022FE0D13|nr:uncharacterized protein EV422DRAFT_150448 [Fimicolochytrium jonesii]KAI8826032.1 hypothetical protein EV422DRAFT_150448 [Fimicolochytrium jonesii]